MNLQGQVLDASEQELRQLLIISERLFTPWAVSWLLDWATGNKAVMSVDGPDGSIVTVSATVAQVIRHYEEMLQEGW